MLEETNENNHIICELDNFILYYRLIEKHFPHVRTLIMSNSLRQKIDKLPLAIKILIDNGFNQNDSEKNALLSINPYLKD